MSWGRYLKLAVIVCVGSSLTLIDGLAQQRLAATRMAANENQQPEAIDQGNEVTDPIRASEAPSKADTAKTAAEAAGRTAQPGPDADASLAPLLPIPHALFLPDVNRLTLIDQAYLDAYSILREENSCSRFYGGARVIEVLNDLKKQLKTTNIETGVAVRMSGPTMSVSSLKYGVSYRLFEKAELNLRGSFFHGNSFRHDQTVPMIGNFPPNTREARVTILLHELGHLVQKSSQSWLLPNDGNNGFLSHQNTNLVLTACGEQIRELSNTSFERELEAARRVPEAALQANMQP